jgi:hypothetical protein
MATLPEPSWPTVDQVQLADGKPHSHYCAGHITPSEMTGYLQALLQEHFNKAENIRDEKLRGLIWRKDSDDETDQSRIHIEPSYAYDVTHLQQRPAMYISRGPVQSSHLAISDKYISQLSSYSGNYEGERYIRLLTGQHQVVVCGSKSRMAVEKLAEEVMYFLLEFSPAIRKDLQISNFTVTAMTEVERIDEDHENYMTAVQVAWMTAHGWTLKPLAPILKSIGLVST